MRARYHGAGSQMRVGDITHSCTRLLTGAARRPSVSLSLLRAFCRFRYLHIQTKSFPLPRRPPIRAPAHPGSEDERETESRERDATFFASRNRRGTRGEDHSPGLDLFFFFARGARGVRSGHRRSINHERTTGPRDRGTAGSASVCVN